MCIYMYICVCVHIHMYIYMEGGLPVISSCSHSSASSGKLRRQSLLAPSNVISLIWKGMGFVKNIDQRSS